jgi:hypothetical protein
MTRTLFAALVLLAGVNAAFAEDTICTPEFYYNTSEATPLVIAVDADRMAGTRITSIDIETGAYHETVGAFDGDLIASGTMNVINRGSHQERSDFVAVNPKTGLLLHISLIDEGLPFTRVDAEGTMASGHCVYEYDLPK